MNKQIIVGISGKKRSGKDTLCQILLDEMRLRGFSAKRIALADALKQEINPYLINKYGIDIFNCSPEDKEKVRPELIELGRERRLSSEGTFWTNIVSQEIEKGGEQFIIVPDIRYNVYENDEAAWVRRRGLLVHLEKYTMNGAEKIYYRSNDEEEANDPKVKRAADYIFEWRVAPHDELLMMSQKLVSQVISHAAELSNRR
jgi:hypothetical protein